jgi:hypothetical protein
MHERAMFAADLIRKMTLRGEKLRGLIARAPPSVERPRTDVESAVAIFDAETIVARSRARPRA